MLGTGATQRRNAWAAGCLAGLCLATGPAHADPCAALDHPAVRQRFVLAAAACPVTAETPHAPTGRPVANAESAHLLLFSRPGLVSTPGVEPPHTANTAASTPRSAARKAQPAGGPAKASTGRADGPAQAGNSRALQLAPQIDEAAQRHDIDPLLLHAIAHVESRHNPQARSHAGALGVMQVMPATAQRFGVAHAPALHDVRTNLEVSATYLKTLQRRFQGQLHLVLAAYHAGEGAVERSGRRVPDNGQTPGYVQQVLNQYRALSQAARAPQAR